MEGGGGGEGCNSHSFATLQGLIQGRHLRPCVAAFAFNLCMIQTRYIHWGMFYIPEDQLEFANSLLSQQFLLVVLQCTRSDSHRSGFGV